MRTYNEAALMYVRTDVVFIETEIQRLGKAGLDRVFDEVKHVSKGLVDMADIQTLNIVLSDAVAAFMEPSVRQLSYGAVRPSRLAAVLSRLANGAQAAGQVNKAERLRVEAHAVSQMR